MGHFFDDTARYTTLLTELYPVVEVSALIRPRLLLVAFLTATEYIRMGVLYHTQKNALQSRLCFSSSPHPTFFRRTRWQQELDWLRFETWRQKVVNEFAVLAAKLEATTVFHVDFPANASDADVRDILLASPLATAFA